LAPKAARNIFHISAEPLSAVSGPDSNAEVLPVHIVELGCPASVVVVPALNEMIVRPENILEKVQTCSFIAVAGEDYQAITRRRRPASSPITSQSNTH
jgi:hypothetical protein